MVDSNDLGITSNESRDDNSIRLTQFSRGAGCGCKISPKRLDEILQSEIKSIHCPNLLVGHETRDDAAVLDLGNGLGIVSTTDFFTPIVDNPTEFGRIAATNAISDIYAMGGKPLMAVAILGWPVNRLPLSLARKVVEGGRVACNEAGIPLSGGHSIDSPEPIFGLAVTGRVDTDKIKKNSTATPGCTLYLTKPLGIGVLTTAEKKGLLKPEDAGKAVSLMCRLNTIGEKSGQIPEVKAMTDVTGFGLLGHLLEMCEGSGVLGRLYLENIPTLEGVLSYIRNYESYGHKVMHSNGRPIEELEKNLLCDPQTSGGLLVAVEKGEGEHRFLELLKSESITAQPIGVLEPLSNSPQNGIFVIVE